MSLVPDESPPELAVASSPPLVFEEGPLLVEYRVQTSTPSHWSAYGVVRRGIPLGRGWSPHPQFVGRGSSEVEAMHALRRQLCDYLDSPLWDDQPCR
jgi:hypothetical protein